MRCTNCDYPLWNLSARACPECGLAFHPSEFEFAPNSVRFCCPTCNQAYYGTDAQGHLVPRAFTCGCGAAIDMDGMVLRPGEGLEDRDTRARSMPWLERTGQPWRRRVTAWLATLGGSLVRPMALIEATPPSSSVGQAWWYMLATSLVVIVVAMVPAMCFALGLPMLMNFGPNPGGGAPPVGAMMGGMAAAQVVVFLGLIVFWSAFVGLWGAVTHGLLSITGGTAHGIRRTYQALCYAGGANITTVIPCMGQYVGIVWWIVSAILMIRAGQRVSGVRATFTVLVLPVLSIVTIVGGYVAFIMFMFSVAGAQGGRAAVAVTEIQPIGAAVASYRAMNDAWPRHGLELIVDGSLAPGNFILGDGVTDQRLVDVGPVDLETFRNMTDVRRRSTVDEILADWPDDVLAHRVGDVVFTYHGIDPVDPPPDLWIAVMCADPNQAASMRVIAVGADGVEQEYPGSIFDIVLPIQNEQRAAYGLPPMPDPRTVRNDEPAREGD